MKDINLKTELADILSHLSKVKISKFQSDVDLVKAEIESMISE